ncbi:MAG TPA: HD domain-containing protein [Puia sp.]|nr:HD domain-containing protein [Puia sp.]
MSPSSRKIINDPVYGFITLDHPLLLAIIAHPYYQRLRRIHQMAFAHLVYPGAVHTRLHHSLGAYHLMCCALDELRRKGFPISPEEDLGAKVAILLHDIGHSPFSHALENVLIRDLPHEEISILIMHDLNKQFKGQLDTAIRIFTNDHPKHYLHQLVSGQLDTDRMDYLTRDSFFTGVSEGVIGYDRILKMLAVHEGELMVEEKAIYSIEKFLVSRRLMYWQVYLHKTVLSAEKMLVRILERVKELLEKGHQVASSSPVLDLFLGRADNRAFIEKNLDKFCLLDDYDVMSAIKLWAFHSDKVLSLLCRCLIDRQLLKVRLQATPFGEGHVTELRRQVSRQESISMEDAAYFVFTGQAVNTTYDPSDEKINILFKNGEVRDISQVDNALIQQTLASPVKKFYICYLNTIKTP